MGCSCSKDQAALVADPVPLPVTTAAAAKANAPDEQPLDVPPQTTTSAADSLPVEKVPLAHGHGLMLHDSANANERSGVQFKEEVLLSGQSATSFEKMSEPKKGLLKSTSYVGTQLLNLAKRYPNLAPIAFSLGAVTAHAVSARLLRLDCARLAKLLAATEGALVKLGSAASQQESTLEQLQLVLDDAMMVVIKLKRPQRTGQVAAEVAEIVSKGVLGELRDRLKACIESLESASSAAAGELSILGRASFKESEALASSAWGSAPSSLAGSTRTSEELSNLQVAGADAPDSLLNAADVKVIMTTPAEEPVAKFSIPLPMEEAESQEDIQQAVMHSQVVTMQAMAESRGFAPGTVAKRHPLAPMEAERVHLIKKHKMEGLWQVANVTDVLNNLRDKFQAAYVATYIVGWHSNYLLESQVDGALLGKEPGSIFTQKGRVQARKFSLCQHTVASNKPFTCVPVDKITECFDGAMFADPLLCAVDPGVADQAQRLGTPGSDPLIEEFVSLVQTGAQLIAGGLAIQHVGTPLIMDGMHIGSVCVLHPPTSWGPDTEALLLASAKEIAARLKAIISSQATPHAVPVPPLVAATGGPTKPVAIQDL
ncbi:hypothetical protein V8C86DRAFT_2609490 [Haematococcus lacustris]